MSVRQCTTCPAQIPSTAHHRRIRCETCYPPLSKPNRSPEYYRAYRDRKHGRTRPATVACLGCGTEMSTGGLLTTAKRCDGCAYSARLARERGYARKRYYSDVETARAKQREYHMTETPERRAVRMAAKAAHKRANPEQAGAQRFRAKMRKFSLTPMEYFLLIDECGNRCSICRQPETKVHPRTGEVQALSIDHWHGGCCPGTRSCADCRRHLLCSDCNAGLRHTEEGTREGSPAEAAYLAAYAASRAARSSGNDS